MTFGPTVRYPAGPITPYGANLILDDRTPLVALRSYDDSVLFNLMGGPAIADPLTPERVELEEIRGLSPPWTTIDQKGATQDGTTFVDALYDPMEIELECRAVGRSPAYLRKVVNHLVASLDVKQEAELSWFTHRLGYWWAPVRWFKPPENAFAPVPLCTQDLSLRLRADSAFWQSFPNIDQFRFQYLTGNEGFEFITAPGDPITGWTIAYSGPGSGLVFTDGTQLISSLASNRTAVLRNTAYTAATDNVVAEIELGSSPEWFFPANTYIDLWVRMNNTGTAGTDGIRLRLATWTMTLSSFTAGVETVIQHFPFVWPGQPGEKYTLITGVNEDPRMYQIMRNNVPFATFKETGTSLIDSSHRKAGVGMATIAGAVRPLAIRNWSIGDNTAVQQDGFLRRINAGDQPFWDRYTCIGPGMFTFGSGPGSGDMVQFGPLLPNQIMQVRTDPRKYGVVDMTVIPPTPQELTFWQQAIKDFLSFISLGNVPPLFQLLQSIFGILPPQGNPYSLLDGRFSQPVPPRSPGEPMKTYFVKVGIDDGSAVSQIIATGTPLRRLPY